MGRWDHGNVRCQRTFPTWTCHVPPPPPDVGTFGADVGPPPPPDVGTLGAHVGGGGGDVNVVGGTLRGGRSVEFGGGPLAGPAPACGSFRRSGGHAGY
jgi:hypothetical protein